jgi:chemotaxis protein CheD
MPAISKWVIPNVQKALVVGVADMVASNDPSAELVTYSLGSCLGVTVYDPANQVGGLLHVMLPDSSINPDKAVTDPYMFMDTGLPRLFRAVYSLGGDRSHVIIKAAGGGQFLDSVPLYNIGQRNSDALRTLLARNGYALSSENLGGTCSRTLRLLLSTGCVTLSSPGTTPYIL